MRHLLLVPIVLAALTLGAHLLRGGSLPLAVAPAALPLLPPPRSAAGGVAFGTSLSSWA